MTSGASLLFLNFGRLAGLVLFLILGVNCIAQDLPVRTVGQFIADAPQLGKEPVCVRATVTAAWGNNAYFLQDHTAAIFVFHKADTPVPRVGDLIEATGTTATGGRTPHIDVTAVRSLGPGRMPVPRVITPAEALAGQWDASFVSVRGRVAVGPQGRPDTRTILLEADGASFSAEFEDQPDGNPWPPMQTGELVEVSGALSVRGENDKAQVPFRIMLRSRGDVRVVGSQPWWMPPRLHRVLAVVLIAVAAALVWAGVLRRQVREQMREIHARYDREVAAQRKYRDFVQSATDIVLTHDLDGKLTSFNPAGQRLLGWTPAEILGRNISELLAPEERGTAGGIVAAGRALPERERGETFRLDLLTKDGRTLPFEISSWLEMHDGKVLGVQSICRDITERRRAEEERTQFERKLQETQKLESLGILAGGIAHDFNNLLTGILGNASLALLDVAPGTPITRSLHQIEIAAERAADLCRQMLAYSGHGRFVVERLDVGAIVQGTADLLRVSIHKKVTLNLQLADALSCVVADATQLRQIVMNLVINANEAIGDQPGTITVTTGQMKADRAYLGDAHIFTDATEGDYVFIDVRDTGCGMDAETQARIFDPFFTTKFTGRGLGLAAVLGIVRGHRGALKVASTPERGSSFRLLLPSAGPMPRQVEFAFPIAPEHSGAGLVLVVDDEETVRRVTQGLLESMGYVVITAVDGLEGLERFREASTRISAVVLDLTMPRMDGAELFREMQRIHPGVRVLLMSGFAEQQALARFAGEGLTGFIQKPFAADALRTKLDAVLHGVGSTPRNVIPMTA